MIHKYSDGEVKLTILNYKHQIRENEMPYNVSFKKILPEDLANYSNVSQFMGKMVLGLGWEVADCVDVSYLCPDGWTTYHGPEDYSDCDGTNQIFLDNSDCFGNEGGTGGIPNNLGDPGDTGGITVTTTGTNTTNPSGGGTGGTTNNGGTGAILLPDVSDVIFQNFIDGLGLTLQNWINNPYNITERDLIKDFLEDNNNSPESENLVEQAIVFLINNPQYNFSHYENWFGMESEGKDYEYDADYWEDPSLTFAPQNLPTWDDFYAAFPRKSDGSGWLYGANNVYSLVGGDVLQIRLDDLNKIRTNNTCALKVSIALNGSGIIIPEIITSTTNGVINYGTVKGADGKNYFLNAKSLNKWMKLTFGTTPINTKHFNYTAVQGGVDGKNFPSLIGDKKGIYSLNSSSPTWATGHADIFLENKCSAGCHYNAPGLESIDLWVLD
jgi:hypothetical protein